MIGGNIFDQLSTQLNVKFTKVYWPAGSSSNSSIFVSMFEFSNLGGSPTRGLVVSIITTGTSEVISRGMEHLYSDPGNFTVKPTV